MSFFDTDKMSLLIRKHLAEFTNTELTDLLGVVWGALCHVDADESVAYGLLNAHDPEGPPLRVKVVKAFYA